MIPLYSPPPSNHHTVAHIYESLKIYLHIKRSTRPEPNLSRGSWKREITALLPNASLTLWLCLGRVCLYPWNIFLKIPGFINLFSKHYTVGLWVLFSVPYIFKSFSPHNISTRWVLTIPISHMRKLGAKELSNLR